jgi:hypothetical protein
LPQKVTNIKCRLTGLHGHHQVPLKNSDIRGVAIPRLEGLIKQTVEDRIIYIYKPFTCPQLSRAFLGYINAILFASSGPSSWSFLANPSSGNLNKVMKLEKERW